ncbi:MAG: condensation domain-containing protein [Thiofilum sp.]|uniref:condensation domain-containing protein n=1 Tax=Thiofilum sp. TaxID=2212733 RepID=UPI0025F0AFBA|nr:condensation domain-containing protein [Thiofilum sp.]MBK8452741.1 hypothetical protein [Thiofilum sp.]
MKKNDLQDIYPLAPLQEGLLFHYLSDEQSNAYFEQITFRLQGEVDLCLFEASWNLLLQRHDILRTVFSHEKTNRPLQVVLRQRQIELRYHDLSYLPSVEQQQQLQHYQQQDRHQPFNLTKDVLMRFYALQRATDDYWMIWSHPHILLDGWSVGILYREFIQTYQAFKQGLKPSFANAVPYVRYIQWLCTRQFA